MKDTTARLERLVKKAFKITDDQVQEAAKLLMHLYSKKQDEEKIADYLMKFKSTVCLSFFEASVETLDLETQIKPIYTAICSTEAYKKNTSYAATSRGFIIFAILLKNDMDFARDVLMYTLQKADKGNRFSDKVISLFRQCAVDYLDGMEPIKAHGEKPWHRQDEQERFERFVIAVENNIKLTASLSNAEGSSTSAHSPNFSGTVAQVYASDLGYAFEADRETLNNASELSRLIASANKEATELLESLVDHNGAIAALRKDVSERDAQIKELSAAIREKDQIISELQQKNEESNLSVIASEKHIADLSAKLQNLLLLTQSVKDSLA